MVAALLLFEFGIFAHVGVCFRCVLLLPLSEYVCCLLLLLMFGYCYCLLFCRCVVAVCFLVELLLCCFWLLLCVFSLSVYVVVVRFVLIVCVFFVIVR